jgi:hypothetical protein
MGESISVIEDLIGLYELLASMVKASGRPPKDEIVAPGQFLLTCRYNLTLATLTTMRGHINDSSFQPEGDRGLCLCSTGQTKRQSRD